MKSGVSNEDKEEPERVDQYVSVDLLRFESRRLTGRGTYSLSATLQKPSERP
jgi:hypothetical protein